MWRAKEQQTVMRMFMVAGMATLAGCNLDSLLEVDLPGRVIESSLEDPRLAETLVNSVIADVECSWDNFVAAAAHHSDEWIASSGNSTMARWGLRDVPPTFASMATAGCGANYGLFTPLHGARVQANANFDRISAFTDEEVPRKQEFLATIRGYGGWPLIALSESFCGSPIDGETQILLPTELAALAEASFTEAIQLATAAGLDDIVNMALVGRARARLRQENFAGVLEDAALVPQDFLFVATRDETPGDRANRHYSAVNGLASEAAATKHASIAPNYRALEWMGVADSRVNVVWDGTLGFDFFTQHFRHDKINSRSDPTNVASWREAQLFMAEAYARTDQLAEARTILNAMHLRVGLPGVVEADIPTQDDVIAHVIEERRREFFSEGGHRLNDHLRWRDTAFNVPFLGEPGSIHPDGQLLDPETGAALREYEDWTCFPVPTVEQT